MGVSGVCGGVTREICGYGQAKFTLARLNWFKSDELFECDGYAYQFKSQITFSCTVNFT